MLRNRILLCAVAASLPLAVARRCPAEPTTQVVALRHGGILQGQVRRERDRLVVTQSSDRVIRVPLDTVDFVVEDLDTAYRKKLERIDDLDLQAHFRLAQWCLRHDLPDQAADRLLFLSRQSPTHPWVRVLENRLLQRADRSAAPAASSVQAPVAAAASQPVAIEQFPLETMAQFTRGVQPLLLNRCGQTTCHGTATTSSLQLLRGPHGVQTQVLTWQNLKSVLQQVNDEDPAASPLLQMSRSLHGSAQRLPFEPYERKQFQLLQDWVEAVALGSVEASDPTVESSGASASNASAESRAGSAPVPLEEGKDPFDPSQFNTQFAGRNASAER